MQTLKSLFVTLVACSPFIVPPGSSPGSAVAASKDAGVESFPWPFVLERNEERPWLIKGRVVDSSGKPISEAHVAVIAQLYTLDAPLIPPQVLSQTTTDGSGMFQVKVPSVPWYQCQTLTAIANGAGHGLSAKHLDVASFDHDVEFRLEAEDAVRGHLLEPDGRPAAGVQVSLRGLSEESSDPLHNSSARSWPPDARPLAWPVPAVTDDQGRFVLKGVRLRPGSKHHLTLEIDDPRFGPETFTSTLEGDRGEIAHRLLPAQFIEGTVVRQDTGAPMPGAWMLVVSNPHGFSRGADTQIQGVKARTDENGRFQARLRPGKFVTFFVYPPSGEPYPAWMEQQPWPEGATRHDVKVALPRGILVRGKVVEEESGKGVAGAGVEYQPRFDFKNPRYPGRHPYVPDEVCHQVYWATERHRAVTAADGSFEIGVLPGVGHLMVKAPTPDYVSSAVTFGELQWDTRVAFYYCAEGLLKLDPKPGAEPLEVTIPLRRGVTLRGTVVGPKGEAIQKAALLSPSYSALMINSPHVPPVPVRDGKFELRGYDPKSPQQVFFLDAEHRWGASAVFDVDKALREPPTVRLAPCGSATVVLVDQDNRPWANHPIERGNPPLAIVQAVGLNAAPYDDFFMSGSPKDIGWSISELARAHYSDLRTDAEGRVTLTGLIPGAPHKLFAFSFGKGRQMWREAKEFTVTPGENTDLGTVVARRQ